MHYPEIGMPNGARLAAEAERIASGGLALDRARSAADTVARVRPRFEAFGITRLARLTGLDHIGIPVWGAVRPNAKSLAVCQGKGSDDDAARASAAMEAIEVATAERDDLGMRRAAPRDLAAEGVSIDLLPALIRRGCAPPDPAQPIDWRAGVDLPTGRTVFVPVDAIRLDSTDLAQPYWQSTDGLASGNLLVEAILHGLCERIERDATALAMLRDDTEMAAHCLEPRLLGDATLDDLVGAIDRAGLCARLFDITSDTGIACFMATVSPPRDRHLADWTHFDIAAGYGCHPKRARAAMRAVTEAVQSRLTVISGARDDFPPQRYRAKLQSDVAAHLAAEPRADREPPPDHAGGVETYLPLLLGRVAAVGVRSVLAVPLDIGEDFAVCKVIVTDLEHPPGDRRQRFGRRCLAAMVRRP